MAVEIIRLNVGGRLMTTTRTTLIKHKDSLLEKMFQEDSPLPPARMVDGGYFIDADPDVFCVILTWLRHGIIESKDVSMEHVGAAASFFGLVDLEKAIREASVALARSANEQSATERIAKALESLTWGKRYPTGGFVANEQSATGRIAQALESLTREQRDHTSSINSSLDDLLTALHEFVRKYKR